MLHDDSTVAAQTPLAAPVLISAKSVIRFFFCFETTSYRSAPKKATCKPRPERTATEVADQSDAGPGTLDHICSMLHAWADECSKRLDAYARQPKQCPACDSHFDDFFVFTDHWAIVHGLHDVELDALATAKRRVR